MRTETAVVAAGELQRPPPAEGWRRSAVDLLPDGQLARLDCHVAQKGRPSARCAEYAAHSLRRSCRVIRGTSRVEQWKCALQLCGCDRCHRCTLRIAGSHRLDAHYALLALAHGRSGAVRRGDWRLGPGAVVCTTTAVVFTVLALVGGGMGGVGEIVGSGMAFMMVRGVMRLGVRTAWWRWTVVALAHVGGAQSDFCVAICVAPSAR